MAISAKKISGDHDVYAVKYDKAAVEGDAITAKFANPGDVSVYAGLNDGEFIVVVGKGFKGTDEVTVAGSVGGGDSGSVTFG